MSINKDELLELVDRAQGEPLTDNDRLSVIEAIKTSSEESIGAEFKAETNSSPTDPHASSQDGGDIRMQLQSMEISGKIKLALFGNAICRTLLVRDPSKIVSQFVLKNPKLTAKEVEEFSKNSNIADYILRGIADSKIWMKLGAVKFNIVTNPKTPQDVALKWLRYLQSNELKKIAKSKNIPQLVAITARKVLEDTEKK